MLEAIKASVPVAGGAVKNRKLVSKRIDVKAFDVVVLFLIDTFCWYDFVHYLRHGKQAFF